MPKGKNKLFSVQFSPQAEEAILRYCEKNKISPCEMIRIAALQKAGLLPPNVYTLTQASALCGKVKSWIYEAVKAGRACPTSLGRKDYIQRKDILPLLRWGEDSPPTDKQMREGLSDEF